MKMARYKIMIELNAVDAIEAHVIGQQIAGKVDKARRATLEDVWKETDKEMVRRLEFLRLGTESGE